MFTAARRTPREQRLSAFQRLAMEDGFTQTTLLRHSFRVSPLLFRFSTVLRRSHPRLSDDFRV